MRLAPFLAILFAVQSGIAIAEPAWSGQYLCVEETAAGISYEDAPSRWTGGAFNPNHKFALTLTFERPDPDPSIELFTASISTFGEASPDLCVYSPTERLVPMNVVAAVASCWSGLRFYRFNLHNLRYLSFYPRGYVDGRDDHDNTPMVGAGTCTKL